MMEEKKLGVTSQLLIIRSYSDLVTGGSPKLKKQICFSCDYIGCLTHPEPVKLRKVLRYQIVSNSYTPAEKSKGSDLHF